MTYGYRSDRGRFGKTNYRSPRGRGTSFRGRGRGRGGISDSYYSSSSRDSFHDKPHFRGNSYRSPSFRGRNDHYESRGSGRRYSDDRYSNSGGRRREESSSLRHRDIRESASGSYGREHLRRSDGEPDRKRMRSEVSHSFKEGFSPRRSYDDVEHSNRSYNSNSSPYRSSSSPFGGKSYKKEFTDFKKPLPPSDRMSYNSIRPSRGIRGRGSTHSRIITGRVTRMPVTSYLKRSTFSRIKTATPTSTSRFQLLLRKKKQARILSMRREREARIHPSTSGKSEIEDDTKFAEREEDTDDLSDDPVVMDEDVDEENLRPPGESVVQKKDVKNSPKKVKKESEASPKRSSPSEFDEDNERKPVTRIYNRIALKCPHCKFDCHTFKTYHIHLSSTKHKVAMEKLLFNLKHKLRRLRTEQRQEQRLIDERDDNFNRTSYCKLCKLNFKQTRQEHLTSDFHVNMSELLSTRCSICRLSFNTPILYEHHRCTLNHLKRKAFQDRKIASNKERDEDNNEDGSFMVLDSVGSADESNEDGDTSKGENDTESPKKTALEAEKKTTIIGSVYIKKVSTYYCKLCKLCLPYHPNRDVEQSLLNHCRTRFHLKRFSLEDARKKKLEKEDAMVSEDGPSSEKSIDAEVTKKEVPKEKDQLWADEVTGDGHKSSEDEDDSQCGNRYDRFSTSDEKDIVEKIKIEPIDDDENDGRNGEVALDGSSAS